MIIRNAVNGNDENKRPDDLRAFVLRIDRYDARFPMHNTMVKMIMN